MLLFSPISATPYTIIPTAPLRFLWCVRLQDKMQNCKMCDFIVYSEFPSKCEMLIFLFGPDSLIIACVYFSIQHATTAFAQTSGKLVKLQIIMCLLETFPTVLSSVILNRQ